MLGYFYEPCNPGFQGAFFFPQSPVQIHLLRDSQHVSNGEKKILRNCLLIG